MFLKKKNNLNQKNYINNDKFLKKKNIQKVIISAFCLFCYVFLDVMFISGDYDIKLYTTGIHGIGDAVAKILIEINPRIKQIPSFNGFFSAYFFGFVNLLLFIFISFPKLNFKFSMNSFINAVLFVVFLLFLTSIINDPKGQFYQYRNFFRLIPREDIFMFSLLRVFICSILSGLVISICLKIDSSTGGIDIIAKYISIYKKKDISLCIIILNFSIAIFSVIFICIYKKQVDFMPLILTFMKLFLNSFTIYFVLNKSFFKTSSK